ncbi:assimilatory sulfite reductase (NADPH) flavoprotein subunit [Tolumonas osonensis]|uniref:Sulfite reductase [NADPH] flavoprotein alpha-component n=1 Tax=Tolumonas osonensis TaxID=675874 RepID=A0A841GD95_9GAMM|nr:assimilatory sulfite reductase (NADPH) flavoprotein subunit [Tolumonas osonensis]MBB6055577.1 sulfite reductase (NADPH) flavoprotein alpha-component [Tolumonas osonensis]
MSEKSSLGPLNGPHLTKLAEAVANLSQSELIWASGYLFGLAQGQGGAAGVTTSGTVAATAPAAAQPSGSLTILFGSQTGNAKGVAESVKAQAEARGIPVSLVAMNDYKPKQLKKETHVLIVTSTYGEGEPPEAAADLHAQLKGGKIGKLFGLQYAVLGLGDSSYEFFCQTAKDFDAFFEKAEATRLQDAAILDVDYRDAAASWATAFLDKLASALTAAPAAAAAVGGSAAVAGHSAYDKFNPFTATLSTNQKITGRDSTKDIRHFEINLEGSGITYQPGDALGIWFDNDAVVVAEILSLTGLTGDEQVTVSGKAAALSDALTSQFELTRLHAGFITGLAEISADEQLKALAADKDETRKLAANAQIVDVLKRFPTKLTAEQLVGLLRALSPRLYSIASAQSEVEEEVHLTVGVVRYPQEDGSVRSGGASSFLADRVPEGGDVRVFIEHNDNFRLPANPETPVIMVGPGTGIAPFRSFIQERDAQGAEGKNWLFFGNPHFTQDFLYQVEWQKYVKSGLLTKIDLAFSRDQDKKIYVQDKLKAKGAEVWQWLQDGAHFYVCGDANRMAKDVHEALVNIVAEHGGKSAEQAEEYVNELRRAKRYQRDVY